MEPFVDDDEEADQFPREDNERSELHRVIASQYGESLIMLLIWIFVDNGNCIADEEEVQSEQEQDTSKDVEQESEKDNQSSSESGSSDEAESDDDKEKEEIFGGSDSD